ncbi:MAG: beta-galactosidase [Bdellovibrionota bacterium]
MSTQLAPVSLDYCAHPAHEWPGLLDEARRAGHKTVQSHVFWGVHETAPRMCDFSRASQRGLERFLNLVKERGMEIELRFGFPPGPKTFPNWVWGAEDHALIPLVFWQKTLGGFAFTKVPSIRNKILFDGYLNFLRECFALLELYIDDSQTVREIFLDFGVYGSDATLVDPEVVPNLLKQRYGRIDNLNTCYGTGFHDFSILESKAGFRLLFDRRPWLAAFDYRWCRSQQLVSYWDPIAKLAKESRLSRYMRSSLHDQARDLGAAPWVLGFDSIHIDSIGEAEFPIAVEGRFHSSTLHAFKLWESLKEQAVSNGIGWCLLPLWEEAGFDSDTLLVVASGKYLARATFQSIHRHLDQGGHVLFPFGLAQYNEGMNTYKWPSRCEPLIVGGRSEVLRLEHGNGSVWVPSQPIVEGAWDQISQLANFIVGRKERHLGTH